MQNKIECLEKMGYEVRVDWVEITIYLKTNSKVFGASMNLDRFESIGYSVETLVNLINKDIQKL